MAKFAITDVDGQLTEDRFDTVAAATAAAKETVTDSPESEVEVLQVLKRVSSSLDVKVEDVQ